jgi:hypothetical protein
MVQHPRKYQVMPLPTFCPTDEIFLMHIQEYVSNGSQATEFLWTVSQEQGLNASQATPHVILSRIS